jgi:hypothetical protein
MSVLTATVGRLVFGLIEDRGRYCWTWPDGSLTNVVSYSVQEARRAFAFRATRLAREWNERSIAA